MKTFFWTGVLCVVVSVTSLAAESTRNPEWRATMSPKKFCDPVCSLRSQDAAFSLLIETFRQHQSFRIEMDYQYRLQQITEKENDERAYFIESNSEGLKMLRRYIYGLVKRERELRMGKLETQVANFQAAYSCVRKIDEDYVGEKVPKNLDQRTAQATLKEMVILSPGSLAHGDVAHARLIAADTVLLNPPPSPTNERDLIEPCD